MSDNATKPTEVIVSDDNLNGNYIVEKAKPLSIMRNMPFTLGEFKILDTYLSRINARDPSRKTVRFSLDEYEKLMGVSRMHPSRLEKTVDTMMRKLVTVADGDTPDQWSKFVLFSSAKCRKDEKKQWYIELTCSEEASALFFELSETGYFKYYLSNVTSLNSVYSYYMYLYFLKNDYRSHWVAELSDLRDALCCTAELYNDFRYFKNRILEKSVKEINEKTNLQYEFKTVKSGRTVVAIEFTRIKNAETPLLDSVPLNSSAIEETLKPRDFALEAETKYKDERIQFIAPACNNEFNEDEFLVIFDLLTVILPKPSYWDTDRYDYLMKKYNELNLREKKLQEKGEHINNRFAYLKKIIEADVPR